MAQIDRCRPINLPLGLVEMRFCRHPRHQDGQPKQRRDVVAGHNDFPSRRTFPGIEITGGVYHNSRGEERLQGENPRQSGAPVPRKLVERSRQTVYAGNQELFSLVNSAVGSDRLLCRLSRTVQDEPLTRSVALEDSAALGFPVELAPSERASSEHRRVPLVSPNSLMLFLSPIQQPVLEAPKVLVELHANKQRCYRGLPQVEPAVQ